MASKSNTTKGQMSVQQAGKRGGEATASTHDRSFYENIGHQGGQKGGQRVRELIEKGKQAEQNNA